MNKSIWPIVILGVCSLAFAKPEHSSRDAQRQALGIKPVQTQDFKLDTTQVDGSTDDQSLTTILVDPAFLSLDDMKINRDFRDYLVQTADRETMERANNEN